MYNITSAFLIICNLKEIAEKKKFNYCENYRIYIVPCQVWADSVGPGAPPQLWAEAAADPPGSEWGVC